MTPADVPPAEPCARCKGTGRRPYKHQTLDHRVNGTCDACEGIGIQFSPAAPESGGEAHRLILPDGTVAWREVDVVAALARARQEGRAEAFGEADEHFHHL